MKLTEQIAHTQQLNAALHEENRDLRLRVKALETENTCLSLYGIDLEKRRRRLFWMEVRLDEISSAIQ